jgi:hypothetical protein
VDSWGDASLPDDADEKISFLKDALEKERTRANALAMKVDELLAAQNLSSPSPQNVAALEQQLIEVREKAECDSAAWAAERQSLTSSLESQKRAKASAEDDRDFFRAQYMQASGYVSSVRQENDELEKRATIAEQQAQDGVRLVRELFAERAKQLEAELKKFRDLSKLLIEKDKRTGDDIRRRAGEEPRLRARCEELEIEVEHLAISNEALRMELDKATARNALWENEDRADLDNGATENDLDMASGEVGDSADDGDELVYRCQWRADGTTPCENLFLDVEVCQRLRFSRFHPSQIPRFVGTSKPSFRWGAFARVRTAVFPCGFEHTDV